MRVRRPYDGFHFVRDYLTVVWLLEVADYSNAEQYSLSMHLSTKYEEPLL